MDAQNQIKQLQDRLELLVEKQKAFIAEINTLRQELKKMQQTEAYSHTFQKELQKEEKIIDAVNEDKEENQNVPHIEFTEKVKILDNKLKSKQPKNIEAFIGENLIGKIGIIITVLGVALGAKYAIEKGFMGPLLRVISSYIFGLVLLGLAFKLKKKYENYSAVLLSGAMAIMYFVSYTAYGLYDLIPQIPAFVLMLIFTVFTVFSSISYNKQVIALIGLVGAYTIPFLLSDNKNQVHILFSYMSIINLGILVLSFQKYWKSLFYASFSISWLIFFAWYVDRFNFEEDFKMAFAFLSIFYILFYISFLAYKLIKKEVFDKGDILLLLSNAFIFYAFGYHMLDSQSFVEPYLGIFTIFNAVVHFLAAIIVYKQKTADKNLLYFISGLVLIFVTIAIPVQLNGKWVTMLWAGEAALFLWIGRSKQITLYENIAIAISALSLISLVHDWVTVYDSIGLTENLLPIFANIYFATSLLVAGSFAFQIYVNKTYASAQKYSNAIWNKVFQILPVALLLITLYFSVVAEIIHYFEQLFESTKITIEQEGELYPLSYYNYNLDEIKYMWIQIYSLLFAILLLLTHYTKIQNKALTQTAFFGGVIAIIYFLSSGLWLLSEMRETYLNPGLNEYFPTGNGYLFLRYLSIVLAVILLAIQYFLEKLKLITAIDNFSMYFDLFLYGTILWILSSELLQWMALADLSNNYKLGLSILWGVFSVGMIMNGIRLNLKHLRIMAISLFGFTLIKLFFYDIAHLNMLHKIIIFVSLGLLLLLISFLYTKYKHLIFDDDDEEEKTQN